MSGMLAAVPFMRLGRAPFPRSGVPPAAAATDYWSGIIDDSRATQWDSGNAGVAGGIPTRNTIYTTLNAGSTSSQINTALSNCPSGQVVKLGAGTFNLSGTISITNDDVTLRGSGPDQTQLIFSSGKWPGCIYVSNGGSYMQAGVDGTPAYTANWTAGYASGTTVITLSNTTGLSVGAFIFLDQENDTGWPELWVCSNAGVCSYASNTTVNRSGRKQRQLVRVAAIDGNDITIENPIAMPNWRSALNPQAFWQGFSPVTGVGIEDLTVDYTAISSNDGSRNIYFLYGVDCWVKNVRSVMAARAHVEFYGGLRYTVRDSYFYGNITPLSQAYGIEHYGAPCNVLVENNIFQRVTGPIECNDGGTGNVYAYNFTIDNYRYQAGNDYVIGLMQASAWSHAAGDGCSLFEGNSGLGYTSDNYWGTSSMQTLFRNHFYGDIWDDPSKIYGTSPIILGGPTFFYNLVGNVLGRSGYYDTYEPAGDIGGGATYIFFLGSDYSSGGPTSANTKASLFRWGNYDTVTAAVRWESSECPSGLTKYANAVPASQTLPASFYLSEKPAFMGSVPWPPVGPDVTGGDISGFGGHAYKIPARAQWEGASNDTAYTGGDYTLRPVKVFNADDWYYA